MDKTMEVVLVLVSLLAAVAIVTSMLQGRTQGFEGFAQEQTTSSSCSISVNRLKIILSGQWWLEFALSAEYQGVCSIRLQLVSK